MLHLKDLNYFFFEKSNEIFQILLICLNNENENIKQKTLDTIFEISKLFKNKKY